MIQSKTQVVLDIIDPLEEGYRLLEKNYSFAIKSIFLPFTMVVGVFAGFFYFQPNWYKDPFIDIILTMFTVGQIIAFFQFKKIYQRSGGALQVFHILKKASDMPDMQDLRDQLVKLVSPVYYQEVLLRWLTMIMKGRTGNNLQILDSASQRRDLNDQKEMSFHVTLNRITLKMGFLGTLIGLLMTFGPMRDAILSLRDLNGEMAFVTDIVEAIKGDRYAIFSTLIATGLSLLIELLTLQILMRLYHAFSVGESCLADWNVLILEPASELYTKTEGDGRSLEKLQTEMDGKIASVKRAMEVSLISVVGLASETERQFQKLQQMYVQFNEKIESLQEFELTHKLTYLKEMEKKLNEELKAFRNVVG
ncbi:MAG: hypothetical protein HQK83_12020 [Fibrobacteria bacterium]|nr:hypothetical protein [Fibrobacteria bacterium]